MKVEASPVAAEQAQRERRSMEQHPELKSVSRQFESLLVNKLVDAMRKTVVRQGVIPQSHAEKVFESMLDTEYAKEISQSDQIGLAKLIYGHLLHNVVRR